MFNWIFRISCFHFTKHLEKQCCWHGRSSKKILTLAYKDYGTLKRNFVPWLQVTKTVCVFYLVSLHIRLPLTPTPFIIDGDITGVWVDDKFIITVVANKGTFPGKRHVAISLYALILLIGSSWFVNVVESVRKCERWGTQNTVHSLQRWKKEILPELRR